MSARTLELKLKAPVACLDCQWLGRTGELITGGFHLRCPQCDGGNIKWIENEPPKAIQ